jgi:hypothetical protein
VRPKVLCGVRKRVNRRDEIEKRRWRIKNLPSAKKTKLAGRSLHQGHSHLEHTIALFEKS